MPAPEDGDTTGAWNDPDWNDPDWSDNANPTRTTTAATIAARITTRNGLRMFPLSPLARRFPDTYQLQVVCRIHHGRPGSRQTRGNSMAPCNCAVSTPIAVRTVSRSLEKRPVNMERVFTNRDILGPPNVVPSVSVIGNSDVVSSVAGEYADLLSLAAHEFRAPANVVSGYLRMLQHDTVHPLSERQRQMIDEAQKSCARLVALISELGEVANLDTDSFVLNVERFDLFQLIREVAEDLHQAEDRNVQLQLRGETAGASVSGDRVRLSGAFSAFFRAMLREQPSASIAAVDRILVRHEDGASAVVVVAPEGDLQHAYEAPAVPFDEVRGGLGLALPIARRVIERHGGRVWTPAINVSHDQVAQSAVIVSLPASASPEHDR
jgi:hypothetical protein